MEKKNKKKDAVRDVQRDILAEYHYTSVRLI